MKLSRRFQWNCWFGTAVFLLLAALSRGWVAPYFEMLPANFVAETSFAANFQSRQTPSSPAVVIDSTVRRRDQTLAFSDEHSIIQGDAHWATPAGAMIFETRSLYGVDRRNRQNLAGYGDQDRTGQFLFPPHTEKKQYSLWDPIFSGPATATFDHVEQFRGIEVYVFNFLVDGLDETAGFASLPDVPETYGVLTYAKGVLRVEPVSGIIIDREDGGAGYFVARETGQRVGEPVLEGSERYTQETIDAQFQLAKELRRRMLSLEIWIPAAFTVAGLIAFTAGIYVRRAGVP